MRNVLLFVMTVVCLSVKSQINITPFMPADIVNAYPDAACRCVTPKGIADFLL